MQYLEIWNWKREHKVQAEQQSFPYTVQFQSNYENKWIPLRALSEITKITKVCVNHHIVQLLYNVKNKRILTSIDFTSSIAAAAVKEDNPKGERRPPFLSRSYLMASWYTLLRDRVPSSRALLKMARKDAPGLFSSFIMCSYILQMAQKHVIEVFRLGHVRSKCFQKLSFMIFSVITLKRLFVVINIFPY